MNEESKRRLSGIFKLLSEAHLTDANIDKMESLIHECHRIAVQEKLDGFAWQLNQTIMKELKMLLLVKSKPRKRIDPWRDFLNHFKTDFSFVDLD